MRKKLLLSLALVSLLLVIQPGQISLATPTPLYVLVNESTRECYITILGDECSWCDPPQGWKILNWNDRSCPPGYKEIDQLDLNCTRKKDRFCCGVFSSHGDCEDMIVNATQDACAFVEDIDTCILPEGWSKRPEDVSEWNWSCNTEFRWVEDVTCLTAQPLVSGEIAAIGGGLVLLGGGILAWLARKRVK